MASSTRVLDVLTSPTEIKQGDFKPEVDLITDSNIVFKNVHFAYTGRDKVFDGLRSGNRGWENNWSSRCYWFG
jgi:ABC-type multidrug transport system fused ATPase/permease subunit